ncbi:MAG: phosphatidate cytidylyltransferase [Planctomycetota bacterium]
MAKTSDQGQGASAESKKHAQAKKAKKDKKANRNKGLVRRRITFGLILAAVVGGLLWLDYTQKKAYGLGVLAIVAVPLGLAEVFRMLDAVERVSGRALAYIGAAAVVLLQIARRDGGATAIPPDVDFLVLIGVVMGILFVNLAKKPTQKRLVAIALAVLGTLYVVGLGSFALRVRYLTDLTSGRVRALDLGFTLLCFSIVMAKGTDICAFFVGRALGRRKMIPWISPGKTWAGAVGAVVGGVAIAAGFMVWTDLGRVFPWWGAALLGILLALVTMTGDLCESLIKRGTAVKDSGRLVPEFGGVLDIIDSILFVLPVVYVAALIAL